MTCEWCGEAEASGQCAECDTWFCEECGRNERCPSCGEAHCEPAVDADDGCCAVCAGQSEVGQCAHCGLRLCHECDRSHDCADTAAVTGVDFGDASKASVTRVALGDTDTREVLATGTVSGDGIDWDGVAMGVG